VLFNTRCILSSFLLLTYRWHLPPGPISLPTHNRAAAEVDGKSGPEEEDHGDGDCDGGDRRGCPRGWLYSERCVLQEVPWLGALEARGVRRRCGRWWEGRDRAVGSGDAQAVPVGPIGWALAPWRAADVWARGRPTRWNAGACTRVEALPARAGCLRKRGEGRNLRFESRDVCGEHLKAGRNCCVRREGRRHRWQGWRAWWRCRRRRRLRGRRWRRWGRRRCWWRRWRRRRRRRRWR